VSTDAPKNEVEEYIRTFPAPVQERLQTIRKMCFEVFPDAGECIKYAMPTVVWHGNAVHYAGYKNHIGMYPLPGVLEQLKSDLTAYKTGKGSVQFPLSQELPVDLIRKILIERKKEKENGICRN